MRPTRHETMLKVAQVFSERGTCPRRQVGCVLVNKKGHVLSTGYNGVPRGQEHCISNPCPGANCKPGEGLHLCEAVHAEANALLQCKDMDDITIAYCTDSPCLDCVKLLLQTSCYEIIFLRQYPHTEAKIRWERAGRIWTQWPN